MPDATLSWQPAVTGTVTGYQVTWMYKTVAQPPISVPRTAASDAAGYVRDFDSDNPTIHPVAGDVIDATIVTVDATDNLMSTPVTPPAVTIPTPPPPPPPGPPQNVTLTATP